MRRRITTRVVAKTAPPIRGRLEIFDEYLPGFALRITPAGFRSYVVRGRVKGRPSPITITIGDSRVFSLADARQAAVPILQQMRLGTDPREAKRAARRQAQRERQSTVAAVAEAYIREHVAKLRTARRIESDVRRFIIKAWGSRPIASIRTADVAELVRFVASDKPIMADTVLVYTKHFFKWASAPSRGHITVNPAAGLSAKTDFGIVRTPRRVALTADHLRAIWIASGQLSTPYQHFVRMMLFSGQRRNEVAEAEWSEFDFGENVWIIPGRRMKAGRDHEVPLTGQMVELLSSLHHAGPFVFPGRGQGPINNHARTKRQIDQLIVEARQAEGLPPLTSWVFHDIRRAVRTALGAIPSVPHDRELVIAHVPPALVQTYDLHDYRDEKRQALTLWGERLVRIVEPLAEGIVIPLERIAR